MSERRPVVLCFSGHDPCGGAGIQADIEAIHYHAVHCASVLTSLTVQDTHNVRKILPQAADALIEQALVVLADLTVDVIKIGLLGDAGIVRAVAHILRQYPLIPVVMDPILAAGGGTNFANQALITDIIEYLLPNVTILTPNLNEARRLSGLTQIELCGIFLLQQGCQYVLLTGADEPTPDVIHQLFYEQYRQVSYTWPRLSGHYHGSGCTLAASIAAGLARGMHPVKAIEFAQQYTWQSLQTAYVTGKGQCNPNRFLTP